ncbi:hypothetical protein [Lysinibacillus sp. JNUCC 51]|uniref:hypothetical protein n=1 Tax=Lysinibacillus sp. JNUCC-51 TaxID=2792479 RepID=UPI0019381B1A|nr:hypothetical protein JNUCC51_09080 [Lysinibacillus sp. JNUCC-51]
MPLTLRFRAEQSFLAAFDEPLLLLLPLRFRTDKAFAAAALALRFRTENIRFAAGSRANRCLLRESEAAAAPMLVTKALSQDVMVLAFVPLFDDPRGVAQPSLQSTYMHCICFKLLMMDQNLLKILVWLITLSWI